MTTLKAISHRHEASDEPVGTIIFDSADRHLRRKLITTNQGDKVMVDLPEAVLLADGDVLVLEDGREIEVIAAKEKLYEVRAGAAVPISHLAWHLGNRHQAAQIDEDRILIRRDHVIRDMLIGLGAAVVETIERFQPVHGAYHSHGHDDYAEAHVGSHSHSHAHSHSHSGHSHTESHSHSDGKPDRFGRLPGDPHYGHNHA